MTSLRGWIRRHTTTNEHPIASCPARGVAAVPARREVDGPTVSLPPLNGRGYLGHHRDVKARNRSEFPTHRSSARSAVGL